ncbi:MAG: putative 1,5-dienoyl-CoA oxidase [Ignavibacteria bacterium]|nr:putative 1,5-dienoyl-CoA oxidase [Ignavibacteria bacterium]
MYPGEKKYPHIFSPGKIGKMETKNRIKYGSTETNFNLRDGFVTDTEIAYMEAQAKGGAGIITTQGAFTDPAGEGKGYVGMMGIWDDKFIPGLKKIADVIRKHGAKSMCQLMHCGRVGGVELEYTVGPSNVKQAIPRFREPVEMSVEKIQLTIKEHIDGARRIVEAGYDAIEISGIVGYLISNFNSKYTNRRTDEYGGTVEKRARFMREIIEGIRKEVSSDIPLVIRLCGEELLDDRGGNTPEECLEVIKIAERAGIDALSVTIGWQESAVSVITRDIPMGNWLFIAERMKNNLKIPVSMAYRLFVPELPEEAIGKGNLDFWEMCRPMIADPDLPRKVLEDRQEDIIPCMACNLCLARLFRDQPITCMVRPNVGFEGHPEWQITPAQKKKKVYVIGGGPAGMQSAIVAAQRGHDVTLFEKSGRLGGQLATAAKGFFGDDEFARFVDYLDTQLKKNEVKVELNREMVEKDFVDPLKSPDAVVLASGSFLNKKDIPGGNRENVVLAHDVIEGKATVGKRVLIAGGRGLGIAVAQFLLGSGVQHEITMVEEQKKVGRDVNPSYIWRYVKKLKEGHVNVLKSAKIVEIADDGVKVIDAEGNNLSIPFDTVIVSSPVHQLNELAEQLEFACGELHTVGDAVKPRRAHNATMEGYRAGLRI